MSPTFRYLMSSVLIAAAMPIGLAVLDLEQPAFAKNGNGGGNGGGQGGGHGGGNGNGHGGGNDGGGGNQGKANGHAKQAAADEGGLSGAKTHKAAKADLAADSDGDDAPDDAGSLKPSALGKLNGVLHASPQAIANASINSPIGKARAFGEALAGFIGATDETGEEDGGEVDGEEAGAEPLSVEDLGALMAGMTNKPVTAAQVEAVADRLAADDPDNEALQDIDPDLAQDIADEANEIHGFDVAANDDEDDSPESEGPTE